MDKVWRSSGLNWMQLEDDWSRIYVQCHFSVHHWRSHTQSYVSLLMFIHISEKLEMTSCSFLNLITALVHQLSGISWETRKLLIYTENCLPFALSQLSIFQHSSKKVTVFLKINDYLAKMHIFSSSYLLSNSSEEICFFFFQVSTVR